MSGGRWGDGSRCEGGWVRGGEQAAPRGSREHASPAAAETGHRSSNGRAGWLLGSVHDAVL